MSSWTESAGSGVVRVSDINRGEGMSWNQGKTKFFISDSDDPKIITGKTGLRKESTDS